MRGAEKRGSRLRAAGRSALGAALAFAGMLGVLAAHAFAAGGAAPTVTRVAALKGGHEGPAEGPTAGGSEVVISGSNLLLGAPSCVFSDELDGTPRASLPGCSGVIVRFGGEPGLVASASAHSIDVISPAHKAGVVDVTVTTPAGTSATSSKDRFKYVGPSPQVGSGASPAISSIAPSRGPTGGFTTVTITGANLLPAGSSVCVECALVSVSFGKSTVPVLEGTQTELVVVSPPHDAGTVDVLASVAGLQSAASAADRFTYTAPPRHRRHHRHHHRHGRSRRHRH